jgi:hypothetical protein
MFTTRHRAAIAGLLALSTRTEATRFEDAAPGNEMDTNTKNADLTVSVARSAETLCVELRGSADLGNHDHLQAVLQAVPLNGTDTRHLRLPSCPSAMSAHSRT